MTAIQSSFRAPGIKAMILAAGLGTRLKPWTDQHPKALALVNSKSLLQRNIEYLQQYGIYEAVVNVHHFAEQVIEAIKKNDGWGSTITISDETEAVLETGGGLKYAAPFLINAPFFILMNCDVLTDLDLAAIIHFHQTQKPLATLATTARKTSRYFLFNENDELCGWRNVVTNAEKISKPANQYLEKAFSGIHIISNQVFQMMKPEKKFSMVDLYLALADTQVIKCFDHSSGKFIDVGKPESILQAEILFE
jgi:MurNAc alpha-1-phosphate uridylyltransferase